MPILSAEPDLYPADLLERSTELDESSEPPGGASRWWCLHTRPRQEKATARKLLEKGIAYYLPQAIQQRRTPQGRVLRSTIPLFPGYVFMRGDGESRLESFRGNTLVRVLPITDQAALVRELEQVHRVSMSNLPLVPEPVFHAGMTVRILEGPLRGLVGVVDRREHGDRFLVQVRFLGRGVSVELRDWQVEEARLDAEPAAR